MPQNQRIEQIQSFLKENPSDPFLNYALAIEYVGLGKDDLAQSIFEELINKQPDYFATYYHLAKLYERLNMDEKAEEIYSSGLDVTKRLGEQHANRELRSALDELIM